MANDEKKEGVWMYDEIRIVFFKGFIETLDYFSLCMYQAAKSRNMSCYMIDAQDDSTYTSEAFFSYIQHDNCIVITFNQIGTLLVDGEGNNIWEKYNIQIYDIMVDHPRYYDTAMTNPVNNLNVLCIDKHLVRYIKRFYPKIKRAVFFPHGGKEEDVIIPFDKRELDVFYAGSCQPEVTDFPVVPFLPDGGREMYGDVISRLIQAPNNTIEGAIDEYLNIHSWNLDEKVIKELYEISVQPIEFYVRRYYKQSALRELDKLGISVDVYGDNWEDSNYQYGPNIRIHKRVTSRECNIMSGNAKVCLNFMPWFKEGTSERVFNTMLNKAVCVSDSSTVLDYMFRDGEDIVFFDLSNPAQMAYDVKFLIDNPKVAEFIANNGYKKAKTECTWDMRLLEVINLHNRWKISD